MIYSGFADEAGQSIDIQIKATKDIGWSNIEARAIDGVNITDISEKKFEEVCVKLRESGVVKLCEDAGIIYLCENCSDYSALSYNHTLRLLDKINSPAFKLIFDMGNTVGADNWIGNPPYSKQNAWEIYNNVKEFVYHVHIKDSIIDSESKLKIHTFPGEGSAQVKRIVADLIKRGYDGGLSIEPHMNNGSKGYVEYGRRFMKIIEDIRV